MNAEPLAGQGPAAERVAAAALVDLPSMTPARLRSLLVEWPDARQVADAVLERFAQVSAVRVTVHKPHAPIAATFDDVGVTLVRTRQEPNDA